MKTYPDFTAYALDYSAPQVCWTRLEGTRISDGQSKYFYFATHGGIWDGVHYSEPLISELPTVTHKVQEISGGEALVSYGDLVLAADRGRTIEETCTITVGRLLSEYYLAGKGILIKQGGPGLDFSKWKVVLDGIMSKHPSYNDPEWTVSCASKAAQLANITLPPRTYADGVFPAWAPNTAYALGALVSPTTPNAHYYRVTTAGTSGASEPAWSTTDGGTTISGAAVLTCHTLPASTMGQPIPLPYGPVKSASPVLISDLDGAYIYQFGDPMVAGCYAVDAVQIGGLPTASGWTANLVGNFLLFTAKPSGDVTLDFRGLAPGGVYLNKPGDIYRHWLTDIAGIDSGSIDASAFTAYNTAVPFTVARYITSSSSISSEAAGLFEGLLTRWGTTRAGLFTLAKFPGVPSGSPLIVGDLEMEDFGSDPEELTLWQVTINYDRCWTVQDNPDAAVTASRREWLSQEYRSYSAQSQTAKTVFGSAATTKEINTCLTNGSDAQVLAGGWLTLFGVRHETISATASLQPLLAELGGDVVLIHHDYGFQAGRPGHIVSLEESLAVRDGVSKISLGVWL